MTEKNRELETCHREIAELKSRLAPSTNSTALCIEPPTITVSRTADKSKTGAVSKERGESRLELIRQHGTIEDLVAQIQHLKQKETVQAQAIDSLRQNQPNPSAPAAMTAKPKPKPKPATTKQHSKDSNESPPKRNKASTSPLSSDCDTFLPLHRIRRPPQRINCCYILPVTHTRTTSSSTPCQTTTILKG